MTPVKRTAEETERLRTSLIQHAQRLVAREGVGALTMRALAAEAGCAVGLPYKVFSNRDELIGALLHDEFRGLRAALEAWVEKAGTATVGDNLWNYAQLLLDSPSVALAGEIAENVTKSHTVDALAVDTGVPASLDSVVTRYLEAEKALRRIDADVDTTAYGFLIAGAIHNLLVSGALYPRPGMEELRRLLAAAAAVLAPREHTGADAKPK